MKLETYLKENYQKQIIDHAIRAEVAVDGTVSFYIHAHGHDSDTLDFVVTANQLHPKYVIDDMKELAAANPIPPEIRARMDADRAAADSANVPRQESPLASGVAPAREADQQETCQKSRRDGDLLHEPVGSFSFEFNEDGEIMKIHPWPGSKSVSISRKSVDAIILRLIAWRDHGPAGLSPYAQSLCVSLDALDKKVRSSSNQSPLRKDRDSDCSPTTSEMHPASRDKSNHE